MTTTFFYKPESVVTIKALSIKKLTLLGFALVAIPLVVALIYSAAQINQISTQANQAIFSVATLTTANSELNENQLKLERLASQYLVLNDVTIKESYLTKESEILALINGKLIVYQDEKITALSQIFINVISKINDYITRSSSKSDDLKVLEDYFITLANVSQKINHRSNVLINEQANHIEVLAYQVSGTMLISLVTIPVTLLIAGLFIYLITSPLKLLIEKIKSLEQGDFDNKIVLKSSPEISAIAEALEKMRLRLHALELQKSSFIRHISHELKTPLAAIREGTELLYDNSVGQLNDDQQEICHIIKASVRRLQHLIEDLLDFNIVLDSTSLQDSEKIVIQHLIEIVLADHKLDIKRKQLNIQCHIDSVIIYSNVKQLKVILDNILSNAIKYSADNGVIHIMGTLINDQFQLSIKDNGPGINSDIKDKVFDAFYQGPPPKESQIKGSGLGLTIVKELLMRLNGSVTILEQEVNNNGTTMQITLPKAQQVGDSNGS